MSEVEAADEASRSQQANAAVESRRRQLAEGCVHTAGTEAMGMKSIAL